MLGRKTTVSPAHPVRYWSVMLCGARGCTQVVHGLHVCLCVADPVLQYYKALSSWGDATWRCVINRNRDFGI